MFNTTLIYTYLEGRARLLDVLVCGNSGFTGLCFVPLPGPSAHQLQSFRHVVDAPEAYSILASGGCNLRANRTSYNGIYPSPMNPAHFKQ